MEAEKLKPAIEAILFACGTPAELTKIAQALEIKEEKAEELLKSLMDDYSSRKSGIKIVRLGKSYQMCTEKEYAEIIRTVLDLRRNSPLSQAALEVLAIIAYNQPVTKAFVEQIRGVDCSGVVSYKECIAVKRTVHIILAMHQQVQSCIRANCAIRSVAVGLGYTVQLPTNFLGTGLR